MDFIVYEMLVMIFKKWKDNYLGLGLVNDCYCGYNFIDVFVYFI